MAATTVSATANLSANGTAQSAGTISWTAPSLPQGAAVSSMVLSGSWHWSGSGSISSLKINGTSVYADTAFSIAVSGTSASATCTGNKKATGNRFTWSNLIVTYTYTLPGSDQLFFKSGGTWTAAVKAYKRINGSWVEQADLTGVFSAGVNYVKG